MTDNQLQLMNKKLLIAVFVSAMAHTFACAASPKENRMKTVWADKVTSENVWQSYPRPQLQRSQWMNLNGLWQYAVTTQDTPKKGVKFEGQILVPLLSNLLRVAAFFSAYREIVVSA